MKNNSPYVKAIGLNHDATSDSRRIHPICYALFLIPGVIFAADKYSFEGVTEPISQAVIGAMVPGRVDEILVAEGAFVRKGEVILSLEKNEEELNVAMSKLIADSKAELNSARTKMETYQKDYLATKKLFETSNSISEEQVWEKELNYKLAAADYEKQQMLEEKEKLDFDMANVQVAKRIIRAPFDGVVVSIHKNKSESVQALEPLIEIVDVRKCRLTAYIVAPDAQALRKGQEIGLQLDGTKVARNRKGRIEFISPVVDKSSLLRTVKVIFDNTDGSIEPGVTGRLLMGGAVPVNR
jgi:RND family efflux transporter MFP subunit